MSGSLTAKKASVALSRERDDVVARRHTVKRLVGSKRLDTIGTLRKALTAARLLDRKLPLSMLRPWWPSPAMTLCSRMVSLPRVGGQADIACVRLPRFDGQGRWLGQATFANAGFLGAASNSLGVR